MWTIVPSPNTSAAQANVLTSVACTSISNCWAVGYYEADSGYQTLIARWNGTLWTIAPSPNASATQANFLTGVTCASTLDCWTVGYYDAGNAYQTLIERWNGTSWTIVASANSLPLQSNILKAVTCASTSDCWAVGYYRAATGVNQTLVERWNGTAWNIVPSPNTLPSEANILEAVTCTSGSDCWAVGYSSNGSVNQTLIERWNGILWTTVTSPNASTTADNVLTDVTCASASDCWAVGNYYTGSKKQTLIERWNGTAWTIVASANTSATEDNVVLDVACASPTDCWTTGYHGIGGINQTLTERWNGTTWTVVGSPNAFAAQNTILNEVTCVSASDCWAVGHYANGSIERTLIERWDGTSWTIIASPNTSATQSNYLYNVTCASASNCWAVGRYNTGSVYQTLVEHWNGVSWSIVSSPNTSAAQHNYLYGVTCTSASDCWAVGYYNAGGISQTLVEHWNGVSWSIASSPNTGATQNNYLFDVACASASDCWAVGFSYTGSAYQTLVEHWDGVSWSITTSPNAGGTVRNALYGIACLSASDCWAVGYRGSDGGSDQTLVERWDGTSWTIVASPNTSATQNNLLSGMTCTSASDCWATGFAAAGGVNQTLIERWNGTSWAIVASPNSGATQDNALFAVTCAAAGDCWAVGRHYMNGIAQMLAERYTAPTVPLVSVVSRKTHGGAGTFNVDLPLTGTPGIECRSGGANNDHQMVLTFTNPVTFESAAIASGTGAVTSSTGSGTTAVTVNLTGVSNAQTITLTLSGVNDGTSTGDVGVRMGVLVGDTTANGTVNSSDIGQAKANSGQTTDGTNFRTDVTVNGTINSSDIGAIKVNSGTSLP